MDMGAMIERYGALWSPLTFAMLMALATAFLWVAFRPAAPRRDVADRLNDYLDRGDIVIDEDMRQPFFRRAIWPGVRSFLRFFGRLLPNRNLEATRKTLQQAGNPGGFSALDFYGIRVLAVLGLAGLIFFMSLRNQSLMLALRNALFGGVLGFLLPVYWLRTKVRSRKSKILRALPDALDMLTIGVEAGLAFESAMVRVGEKWDNALTRELKRAVAEMQVGMSREDALTRMAERCGVPELSTFVAVLVQSSQLGVSIAQVLHTQAQEMRLKRRQRAEELARQAGIKMIIPLALFVLPSLFIVILGPIVPRLGSVFATMGGR
jgi:tight adherence protein C